MATHDFVIKGSVAGRVRDELASFVRLQVTEAKRRSWFSWIAPAVIFTVEGPPEWIERASKAIDTVMSQATADDAW